MNEEMTIEEMRERADELEELVLEFDVLTEVLYLLDEGFLEMEDGRLYHTGEAEHLEQ